MNEIFELKNLGDMLPFGLAYAHPLGSFRPNAHFLDHIVWDTVRVIVEKQDSDEQEVLLLRRSDDCKHSPGLWSLPGGVWEPSVTGVVAAARELYQETGLIGMLMPEFKRCDMPSGTDKIPTRQHVFCALAYFGEPRINGESSDYRWVKLDELPSYDMAFENDLLLNRHFEIQGIAEYMKLRRHVWDFVYFQ
ncbi:NUDIX hydrolase, partial [Candidatus Woesearchaeota archaeon]|nr:NUDIX hydrolase [Candidatus Woesearchaeota archaeon]